MSGVNRVILLGNLGKDPEMRHLENGRARASFTLATNEYYKNKEGEKVTNTEWHNVVLWSPLAEIADKYLSKGKQVYIEGKLTNRSYTDKEGQAKYITEVVGQNLVLLGNKENDIAEIKERESFSIVEDETGDDLPF
jgi:single-strand DNA-binding protein